MTMTKQQRYRLKHLAQGLCAYCPRPAVKGTTRCIQCNAKHIELDREYYIKYAALLKKKKQERREKYKKEGRCPTCSIPLLEEDLADGYVNCENCRHKTTVLPRHKYEPLFGGYK